MESDSGLMDHFQLSITVAESDIDGLGHVNNVVYLKWMQQAAAAHWATVSTAEDRAAVHWVVIRHGVVWLLDARHPPSEQDLAMQELLVEAGPRAGPCRGRSAAHQQHDEAGYRRATRQHPRCGKR